jgi:hypothetical protein
MAPALRTLLLRLCVALLIVQGVATPAHCLERLAWAASVPVCGSGAAHGPGDDGPPHGPDGCVVCHAVPQGPVPQAPDLSRPGSAPVARAATWPDQPPRGRNSAADVYAARAPPGLRNTTPSLS